MILQNVGVALIVQVNGDVLQQFRTSRQTVRHNLDLRTEIQHLFIEQRRDWLIDEGKGAGKGLVSVEHCVYVWALAINRNMHRHFD